MDRNNNWINSGAAWQQPPKGGFFNSFEIKCCNVNYNVLL